VDEDPEDYIAWIGKVAGYEWNMHSIGDMAAINLPSILFLHVFCNTLCNAS
jgi:hypothetical protein